MNKFTKSKYLIKSKFLIVLFLLFSIIPISVFSAEKSLEKVTIQLKWLHQFQFAGYNDKRPNYAVYPIKEDTLDLSRNILEYVKEVI